METYAIYKQAEKLHAFISTIILKFSTIAAITIFTLSALFPISYAVIKWPHPENWILPYSYRFNTFNIDILWCGLLGSTASNLYIPTISCPFLDHLVSNAGIRFYIDWIIQAMASIFYLTSDLMAIIFYVGIYLYLNAMVTDLKEQLRKDDKYALRAEKRQFVAAIVLHNRILKFDDFIFILRLSSRMC